MIINNIFLNENVMFVFKLHKLKLEMLKIQTNSYSSIVNWDLNN